MRSDYCVVCPDDLEIEDGAHAGLNVIAMLTTIMGASSQIAGWVAHFVIGTIVWGSLFAWLDPKLPGDSYRFKGVVFSVGAGVLMMIIEMPMAGAGLFGINLGVMAPIMTLVLHVIFGAVLGGVYGLVRPESPETLQASHRY